MRELISRLIARLDDFLRRCWLAWRYWLVLRYPAAIAWNKARRSA